MKKKTSPIRGEWARVYRIMRSIAKSCSAYNTWHVVNKDLAMWAAVDVGVNIQRLDSLAHVYASYSPNGYSVLFHECEFDIGYDKPLNIKISDTVNKRKQWQQFAQLLEEKAEADRKRSRIFDIVATVSDEAIARIYNGAIVWEIWDKRGR